MNLRSLPVGVVVAIASVLPVVLAGCSGNFASNLAGNFSGSFMGNSSTGGELVPGKSKDDDVRAAMGAPAEIMDDMNGDKIWFYSKRGPFARQTYAVRIGTDRMVRAVEARLTPEIVQKITPEKMTEKDIRLLLGPPNTIESWPRLNRNIWDYMMAEGSVATGNWKVLSVQFSPDGVVREVRYLDDSSIAGNRL